MKVYHRLPGPLKDLAATARGAALGRRRYGPETEGLVREALERDGWDAERWAAWRAARWGAIARRAAERVPAYRRLWEGRAVPERLEDWPILEKETARREPRALLADDRDPVRDRMVHEHTSGTTGTPLHIWMSRSSARAWYAIYEARGRRWHGVSRRDRWANVGGQLVASADRERPPFWARNHALRQLYMSSYHLAPRHMRSYLKALADWRPAYLHGYTSSLHALAIGALGIPEGERSGILGDWRPRAALTNAEPVEPHQRRAISEAFGCPTRESYGMAELAGAAGECVAGRLHVWPDVGIVEVLDPETGEACPPGTTGDLVLTGLINEDMPFIRYRVGDRGALAPEGPPCPCGALLPALARLEGRTDEVLITPDGRRIGRLDPVFKSELPIHEAQIAQERSDLIVVRYVPASGFPSDGESRIAEALRARVGPGIALEFERLESIPREANGKFRAVVSRIGVVRGSGSDSGSDSGSGSKDRGGRGG